MADNVYLAVDLGASGGRVLAGLLDGGRLQIEEVHRFDNGPVAAAGSLFWDLLGLWTQVQEGLRASRARYGRRIRSVGVDTWGVDFALLGRGDTLLGNPYSYRDPRTSGLMEQAFARVSREEIFAATGLQFMQFNTLYQLLAMRLARSPLLEVAERLLMIPDLFHWLLTGVKSNEFTNATTTQFFDPTTGDWATSLLARLDLPAHILGEIADPGTTLGPLRGEVAAETGLSRVEVVLPGTHDTASAVTAVPAGGGDAQRPDWCYVSSGTWSLMGVEAPRPVTTLKCLELTFTNEGGVGRNVRLLKNITGLWLVQECRRTWARQGKSYSWDELARLAAAAPPRAALIDPDHASFQAPGDMPEAIRSFCQRTGQAPPESEGAIVRTAIESIALKHRYVLAGLEELIGGKIRTIHIVGGGTRNRALCQATADACQRPLAAGPVEATAIGNVMVQAIADGEASSIGQARELIRASFPLENYEPRQADAWDEAYARFLTLLDSRA